MLKNYSRFKRILSSSLSGIFSFSLLSKMVSKYTVVSSTSTKVITLAPPLFPLPFDAIEILILKQLFPIAVPCSGFVFRLLTSVIYSCFNETYYFTRRLSSFSNFGVVFISKFMEKLFSITCNQFACFNIFHFINSFL